MDRMISITQFNSRIPSDAWKNFFFRARNDSDDFLIRALLVFGHRPRIAACARIVADMSFNVFLIPYQVERRSP